MISRIGVLICLAGVINCHRLPPSGMTSDDTLGLYEAVIRAITAEFPRDRRPPVERGLMAWYTRDSRQAPDSAPPQTVRELPDTFVARLTREQVIRGLCPPDGCRRVANAITLSPSRVGADGLFLVQASLQGSGLYQYAARRIATGWMVVRSEELMVY